MKKLKMKSLKSLIVIILVMLIGGGVLLSQAVPSLLLMVKGPQDMETVDFSGDIEGLYVSGTLYGIYDWYCEETEDNTPVSREYLIDAGDEYYMGMKVGKNGFEAADALLYASYDFLDGKDDGTALAAAQYEITGTIQEMPSDSYGIYQDYLGWDTMSAEEQAVFLPYYIAVGDIGDNDLTGVMLLLLMGLIMAGIGLFLLIGTAAGRGQRNVKAYIAGCSDPEAAKERVEYFLENVSPVNGLQYSRDFLCGQNNGTTAFGETGKLVWAYLLTTTHKRNFITVGKSYELVLAFANGSRQSVAVKKEEYVQEHLQTLAALCPKAIIGYTDELDKLFRKDFPQFLALKYNAPVNTGDADIMENSTDSASRTM